MLRKRLLGFFIVFLIIASAVYGVVRTKSGNSTSTSQKPENPEILLAGEVSGPISGVIFIYCDGKAKTNLNATREEWTWRVEKGEFIFQDNGKDKLKGKIEAGYFNLSYINNRSEELTFKITFHQKSGKMARLNNGFGKSGDKSPAKSNTATSDPSTADLNKLIAYYTNTSSGLLNIADYITLGFSQYPINGSLKLQDVVSATEFKGISVDGVGYHKKWKTLQLKYASNARSKYKYCLFCYIFDRQKEKWLIDNIVLTNNSSLSELSSKK